MELVKLGERTWYIPGRVNIGYYEENGKGYLIDSGLDDDQARKILKLLTAERGDIPLQAIINTHSNADHIGGNAFIQKRTGCEVWATPLEGMLTEQPALEALLLWGAWPFAQMRGKFIEAKPSNNVLFFNAQGTIRDTQLIAVPLPGHFLDMVGVKTPDSVFFLADALFDPQILSKYRFSVMLDVRSAHKTLALIEESTATWFVPSHAAARQDIRELVQQNRQGLDWITDAVYSSLERAMTREDILAHIAIAYGLEMDAAHLLLNLTSVSAHLTYLSDKGQAEPFVKDCRLLWQRTPPTEARS